MKRAVVILLIATIGWQGYLAHRSRSAVDDMPEARIDATAAPSATPQDFSASTRFKCDGRTHCGQMTSCEEATFFLRHCPGAAMDGNHDGVPCERQWCQ